MNAQAKIKMLEDADGYPDGRNLEQFEDGETYSTSADLAKCFVDEGKAEYVEKPESDEDELDADGKPTGKKAAKKSHAKK